MIPGESQGERHGERHESAADGVDSIDMVPDYEGDALLSMDPGRMPLDLGRSAQGCPLCKGRRRVIADSGVRAEDPVGPVRTKTCPQCGGSGARGTPGSARESSDG